jgi:hypothetical protein
MFSNRIVTALWEMTILTTIKESTHRILDLGMIGEQIARRLIKKLIKPKEILQIDWLLKVRNNWISVEVKHKDSFYYQNKHLMGLGISQVISRMKLYQDKDIRCLMLIIEPKTKEVYVAWLDILEKTDFIDLKSKIRVYEKKHFRNLGVYEEILEETLSDIIEKSF